MSLKKIIPSEIFISDAPEEQSFIHQYMWRTDNKLVELVFFCLKSDITVCNGFQDIS